MSTQNYDKRLVTL